MSVLTCWESGDIGMGPPTVYDSAVSFCLHSASFASMSHCDLLLQVPSGHRSKELTSPWDCSPISMLQLSATEISIGPVQGTYGCDKDCLCDFHSIETVTDHLLHSLTTSNASLLSQTVVLILGI